MTYFEAALRQLYANEKHHERAIAKLEMRINLLCAYRDQLEDKADIAAELIARGLDCSKDDAGRLVDDAYGARQAKLKVAGYVGGAV